MLNNLVKISRKIELDYGHTLPNHFGFCNQLHGHRATVVATVEGKIVQEKGSSQQGMVMDFKFMKEILMKFVHDVLDHGFAVWKEDKEDLDFVIKRNTKWIITEDPPTAECLAKWAYEQFLLGLTQKGLGDKIKLIKIDWYETPNSCATYTGGKK